MKNIVIGVEGLVSSGKTSMCKELIKLIPNSIYIDAGHIYRGIVLAIAKNKIDLSTNTLNPLELMQSLKVEFKIENNIAQIYIAGNKIDESILDSAENSMGVSEIASNFDNKPLFEFSKTMVENFKKNYNVIFTGRDALNMYPEMDLHLFVTASIESRVDRRYKQYNGKYTEEEIRKMIEKRDYLHEKSGFNKKSSKTEILDLTDCKNAKESADKAYNILKDKGLI